MRLCVFVGLLCYVTAQQVDFNCVTQELVGVGRSEHSQQFQIEFGEEYFEPGVDLTVTVMRSPDGSPISFTHLAIFARDLVSRQPWGEWALSFADSGATSKDCSTGFVAYTTLAQTDLAAVEAVWSPPTDFYKSSIEVLVILALDEVNILRVTSQPIRSKEAANPHEDPSEYTEPTVNPDLHEEAETHPSNEGEQESGATENPNAPEQAESDAEQRADELDGAGSTTTTEGTPTDLHDDALELQLAREADIRRQQQIRDEDLASEGNWSIVNQENIPNELEEEEAMEERWRQEEEERQRILLWEIKDKEEHDTWLARQQEEQDRNQDGGQDGEEESEWIELGESGGSALASTVTSLLIVLTSFVVFAKL